MLQSPGFLMPLKSTRGKTLVRGPSGHFGISDGISGQNPRLNLSLGRRRTWLPNKSWPKALEEQSNRVALKPGTRPGPERSREKGL